MNVEAKLDKIDMSLINSLMQDGRKSFRQISKEIGFSTPTVESHFSKLIGIGVIKNIAPIFDPNKIQNQISALAFLKIGNLSQTSNVANLLDAIPEVKNIYLMTGEFNIVVKLSTDTPDRLEEIVREKIASIKGIESITYHLIARTIKEGQFFPLKEGVALKMTCDYCDNEIHKNSKILKVGQYERHFCCPSCLTLYKQKYKGRIEALAR
jgi:DNA-binding Lrp family transcriptional regulator